MIRSVFQIYVEQSAVLMPAAAVVFLITGLLATALLSASPGLALLALVFSVLGTSIFTGMIVELVAEVRKGGAEVKLGALLRSIRSCIGRLIGVSIFATICEGFGLLLFIVPGLILLSIWSVYAPVIVLEDVPGLGSLGRSRELVRGNGWRVFTVILMLVLMVALAGSAITLAAESAGAAVGLVVRVVIGVLIAPLSSLAAAVLYFELRDAHGE
ncbi:MAG TPA: hypothetical protein VKU89_02130 [Solirubrobacteraceae bacterium]|nr:hypothetical protein [Solirubrobacteraceae bacterium]